MSVLDRTREFGIMQAIGIGLTAYRWRTGIDLSAFEPGLRAMRGLADVIFPVVVATRSAVISALVFLIAVLSAAAWRAIHAFSRGWRDREREGRRARHAVIRRRRLGMKCHHTTTLSRAAKKFHTELNQVS